MIVCMQVKVHACMQVHVCYHFQVSPQFHLHGWEGVKNNNSIYIMYVGYIPSRYELHSFSLPKYCLHCPLPHNDSASMHSHILQLLNRKLTGLTGHKNYMSDLTCISWTTDTCAAGSNLYQLDNWYKCDSKTRTVSCALENPLERRFCLLFKKKYNQYWPGPVLTQTHVLWRSTGAPSPFQTNDTCIPISSRHQILVQWSHAHYLWSSYNY